MELRKKSTDPTQWSNSFKIGDKVRITEDFSSIANTNAIYSINSINKRDIEQIKRVENPSGLIYVLDNNGGNWEGKDLEYSNEDKNENSKNILQNISSKLNENIKQKIKELKLLPLFPDKNFNYTEFELSDTGQIIDISELREEENLRFTITLFYSEKNNYEEYVILGRVYNYENGEDFLQISESYTKVGIFEAINKFNELYEILAKKFNELLLKNLKEELEKEKQKAKEKEDKQKKDKEKDKEKDKDKEGQDGEGQDSEGEDSEGEDSEGEDSEGQDDEGQDGEGQDGEGQDGEGEDGEGGLSSSDIQDLINQIDQDNESDGSESQSDVNGVDFEDFLNKVNEGKIPNDFTKNYNNPELIREINSEKEEKEPDDDLKFLDADYDRLFEEKKYGSFGDVLKEQFKINDLELKRRFPNPDFVKDFVSLLSKKEVDNFAQKIGIEDSFNTLDKKNKLTINLITEIQNL